MKMISKKNILHNNVQGLKSEDLWAQANSGVRLFPRQPQGNFVITELRTEKNNGINDTKNKHFNLKHEKIFELKLKDFPIATKGEWINSWYLTGVDCCSSSPPCGNVSIIMSILE